MAQNDHQKARFSRLFNQFNKSSAGTDLKGFINKQTRKFEGKSQNAELGN